VKKKTEIKTLICPTCKGNGFLRLKWEDEITIKQCETCNSQGEIPDDPNSMKPQTIYPNRIKEKEDRDD